MDIKCRLLGACLILANMTNDPAVVNQQSVNNCPQGCLCTTEDPDLGPAVRVQCGDRNLTSVPSTKIDIVVSLFNISFNYLNTLEDKTFFQYANVSYIYLQHCKIESISEKTFQPLENLTFLDLSNNRLTSVSPNLFNGNHRLHTLKLRNNDLSTLQWNKTLLNGPPSLSILDLQSCQISNLSSETFSSLPNLTKIDISNNNLVVLNFDTLSAHQQLQDVNLENNLFKCGLEFEMLLRSAMQSNPSLFHNRTLRCRRKNNELETWKPENQSSLYRPMTTPSVTPSYEPDTNASTTLQPSATLSHKPDTNASTTLNSSATSSNKSDVSRNTTTNHTIPSEIKLILITLIILISLIILIIITVLYILCCCLILRARSNENNSPGDNVQNNTRLLPTEYSD